MLKMFNRHTSSHSSNQQEISINEPPEPNFKQRRNFSFLTKSATNSSSSTIATTKTNRTCPPKMVNKNGKFNRNKSQEITDTEYEYESEVELEMNEMSPTRRGPLLLNSNQKKPQNNNTNLSNSNIINDNINNNISSYNNNILNMNNNVSNNYNNNMNKSFFNVDPQPRLMVNAEPLQQSPDFMTSEQRIQNLNAEYLQKINNLKHLHEENNNKIAEIEQKKIDSFYYSKKLDDVYNDVPLDVTELMKLNAEAEEAEQLRLELEEKIHQEIALEEKRVAAEAIRKRENEWNLYKSLTAARSQAHITTSPGDFHTREKLIDYYDNIQVNDDNVSLGAVSNISTVSALHAAEKMRTIFSPIVNGSCIINYHQFNKQNDKEKSNRETDFTENISDIKNINNTITSNNLITNKDLNDDNHVNEIALSNKVKISMKNNSNSINIMWVLVLKNFE